MKIKNFLMKRHRSSFENLMDEINNDKYKVISFDIFDTLICRPCYNADDVFQLLNSQVEEKYGIDFYNIRKTAEKMVMIDNPSIYEIWNYIAEKQHISNDKKKMLQDEEINFEKSIVFRRESVYRLYQEAKKRGKKIVFTSDMYLTKDILSEMLERLGYVSDIIFVSCETRCRKDTGKMYRYIVEKLMVEPSEILHIGDNYNSDYSFAKAEGISARYYPSAYRNYLECKYKGKNLFVLENREDLFSKFVLGYAIQKYFDLPRKSINIDNNFISTCILFPIITSIVFFILQNNFNRYKPIYFAARDGFLPMNAIVSRREQGIDLNVKYIYASRKSYQYITSDNIIDRLDVASDNKELDVKSFLKMIIFDNEILNECNNNIPREILNSKLCNCKSDFIAYLESEKTIKQFYDNQVCLARKYYSKELGTCGPRGLVFDCGYSGSISIALSETTGNRTKFDKVYLWEYDLNNLRDAENGTKTYLIYPQTHPGWCDYLVEKLLSSSEGSCLGFFDDGDNAIPLVGPQEIYSVEKIQKESLLLFNSFCDLLGEKIHYLTYDPLSNLFNCLINVLDKVEYSDSGIFKEWLIEESFENRNAKYFADILCCQNHSLYALNHKIITCIKGLLKNGKTIN